MKSIKAKRRYHCFQPSLLHCKRVDRRIYRSFVLQVSTAGPIHSSNRGLVDLTVFFCIEELSLALSSHTNILDLAEEII